MDPVITQETLQASLTHAIMRRDALRVQRDSLNAQLETQDAEIQALTFGVRCFNSATGPVATAEAPVT